MATSALAGNELGNGGDSYAQEFVALGRTFVKRMREEPKGFPGIDALSAAVEETRVLTKETVEIDGAEVDAVNFPQSKRIELNRARWRAYSTEEKSALVLHEYLGIAKIDDSNYQLSGSYSRSAFALEELNIAPEPMRRLFFGVGAGANSFIGNIGKLYRSEGAGLNARIGYQLSPRFTLTLTPEHGRFSYDTKLLGPAKVSLFRLALGTEWHFLTDKQWTGRRGFDPYLTFAGEHVFRRQSFAIDGGMYFPDSAWALGAGLGVKYVFIPRRAAFWAEGKGSRIFFDDRFSPSYVPNGIPDLTGALLSASAGLQYYF